MFGILWKTLWALLTKTIIIMKKYFTKISLIMLFAALIFSSCQKEPQTVFTASATSAYIGDEITFTNTTIDGYTYSWDFGDGSTSTDENPTYTYSTAGTYSVTLTSYSKNGKKESSTSSSIEIKNKITFNNPTFTVVHVTVGTDTKDIEPGSSVDFLDVENTVDFEAYTYGATSSGTQVGKKITWVSTADLANAREYNLNVSEAYFFMYFVNSGTHVINKLVVNYGTTDETEDNILINNDGTKYSLGYYKANSGIEIRAYYQDAPTTYALWNSVVFSGENNQSITLSTSLKSVLAEGNKFESKNAINVFSE